MHMGSGTALGVIDNPIQRECHTEHPLLAGSGVKGALRDAAGEVDGINKRDIEVIFGPEDKPEKHAGAVSFGDGQIVAFPVRSLRGGYVYATCPIALQRLSRMAGICGEQDALWNITDPGEGKAVVVNGDLKSDEKLVLENYEFIPTEGGDELRKAASWLAKNALPQNEGHEYFRKKIETDLVLLSNEQFGYFVRNSTSVEPHVRIDDKTGTADDGGLFFTECVPPESVFVSLLMASVSRDGGSMSAAEVVAKLKDAFDGKVVQLGGDATTGRGLVAVRVV